MGSLEIEQPNLTHVTALTYNKVMFGSVQA